MFTIKDTKPSGIMTKGILLQNLGIQWIGYLRIKIGNTRVKGKWDFVTNCGS